MRRRPEALPLLAVGGAALPGADRGRRPDGQPAGPALPGRGGRHGRVPAAAPAGPACGLREGRASARAGLGATSAIGYGCSGCCCERSCCTPCRRATPTDRAKAAREHRASSTSPSGCCSCCCGTCRWTRALLLRCLGVAGRPGHPVRRRGLRGVLPQEPVPEPQGGRGQPVRQLLQGQLGLLRPQHLRALPGAGDDRGEHDACCGAAPARGADRGGWCWPGCWPG